mmetsp:Transcript_28637/g.62310  ORF Transcript_28637/g.62310 Transcript_28637/m.62310 type:complete len:175 (+) Transcript_28637:228-752(+)
MAGKGPPDITGMTSLKVDCAGSSLPDRWTAEDLKEIFEKYGSVGDVFIPRERFSAKSRAYAFVRFHSESEAAEAMEKMNGYKLQGCALTVTKANRTRDMARETNGKGGGDRRRRSPSRRRSRSRRRRSPSDSRGRRRSPSSPVRQRYHSESRSESGGRRRKKSRGDSRRSRRRR